MNIQSIVQDLLASGLTQTEIAAKCDCAQSRISEIANGRAANVSFALGTALVALHKSRKRRIKPASTEQAA